MTTDQKIAHIRWYIEQRDKYGNDMRSMRVYYNAAGMGALGAWYADMTIDNTTYSTLKAELEKEIVP